jgi:hypothetical protein
MEIYYLPDLSAGAYLNAQSIGEPIRALLHFLDSTHGEVLVSLTPKLCEFGYPLYPGKPNQNH